MSSNPNNRAEPGHTVLSSDGKKLGTVSAVDAGMIRVEKGFLFVKDYLIPQSAVSHVDEGSGNVHLSYTKDEAAATDWIVTEEEREAAEAYDSPIDGEGYTVLAGAASMPNPLILEETTEILPEEKIEDYQ